MGGSAEIDVETRVAKEREVRDREAGTYDAHRARDSWLADSEDGCVLDALALEPGQTVADVGCGTGRHLPTRSLPLEDASCDRVLCMGVLQHPPSPECRLQAARELLRVLRPGGVLAASAYRWRGHVRRRKEGAWDTGIFVVRPA